LIVFFKLLKCIKTKEQSSNENLSLFMLIKSFNDIALINDILDVI